MQSSLPNLAHLRFFPNCPVTVGWHLSGGHGDFDDLLLILCRMLNALTAKIKCLLEVIQSFRNLCNRYVSEFVGRVI